MFPWIGDVTEQMIVGIIQMKVVAVYACATQKPSSPVQMVPVYPLVGFVMVLKIAKMEVMKLLIVDLAVPLFPTLVALVTLHVPMESVLELN